MDWRPIETAPRDGTIIEITSIEPDGEVFEIWPMRWDAMKENGLFPDVRGFWTVSDGSVTWIDAADSGPTHWRPLLVQ